MRQLTQLLGHALTQGIMIVVPIVVLVVIANYIITALHPIAAFVARRILHVDPGAFNLSYLLAILIALACTMIIGLFFHSASNHPVKRWLEHNLLAFIPGYRQLMDTVEATFEPADAHQRKVMLAPVDGWQFAFVMEELPNDELVVFVAQAPVPRTGNVLVFKRSELRETSLTAKEAFNILRQGGKGFTRI
jgi:uncharacterized membrane protein